MHVIPVIDLQGGLVVRGVGGQRDRYCPVAGALTGGPDVQSVAQALVKGFGFREAYVADLDAILGSDPRWDLYETLMDAGLRLLIDSGLATVDRAGAFQEYVKRKTAVTGIIVALETIPAPDALAEISGIVGRDLAIFSLDLKDGRPLTSVAPWRDLSAEQLMSTAVDVGFCRSIVLDLARVGMGQGTGLVDLCRRLRAAHSHLQLTAGGGVRGRADLDDLADAGCDAVLVASALHDGRLTPAGIQDYVQ